jgi:WD40 repeat protein
VEQALLLARQLEQTADGAPDGHVLARVEALAVPAARELARQAVQAALQAQAERAEKKRAPAAPVPADAASGDIRLQRLYCLCPRCGARRYPLDERLGISGFVSPHATLFLLPPRDRIEVGQFVPDRSLRLTDLGGHQARNITFDAKAQSIGQIIPSSGGLRLLDWDEGKVPRLWDEAAAPRLRLSFQLYCRLSPDASCLAVPRNHPDGSADLELLDTVSGKQRARCVGHKAPIWALVFSTGGKRAASADDAGVVYVWDTATGAKVAACLGHTSKVLGVAFRPDGARLVTTSADGTVRQWDSATGHPVEAPYERHSGEVLSAAYSPDGEWIASGGSDRTLRVWRASERQEVAVLHGHRGAVIEAAFTPDDRRLASLSQDRGDWAGDNTVGVWDADFRTGLPVLHGHTSYIYPVAFSPDGRWIASGSWDGTVRL